MLALIPLLAAFAPQLIQYLAGPKAGEVASSVADIVKTVTGTGDPATALAVATADPTRATELRVQLAKIAADAAQAERQAELDRLRAEMSDMASARDQTVQLAKTGSSIAWAAPTLSVIIVFGFFFAPGLAQAAGVQVDQIWMGALIAGFGAVYQYWLGASASGRRAQEAVQEGAARATAAASATVAAATQAIRQPVVLPPVVAPVPVPAGPAAGPWKRFAADGLGWRVSSDGIVTEEDPEPLRTVGEPVTVTRIWRDYGAIIKPMCAHYAVPATVVVMIIATESRGQPDAYRREPDGRESSGLGQALTATASNLMGRPISVADLRDPTLAIEVTCRYLQRQATQTGLDPILASAGYNAGSLVYNKLNRWRLRSTEGHLDRSARYFGDACVVAARDGWG